MIKPTIQVDINSKQLPDLDFKFNETRHITHGLHPYPARMIPELAKYLIHRLSVEGDTILDPFCGSGTVLVESIVDKRNAIGVDVNPFALLLARVKTTPLTLKQIDGISDEFVPMIEKARSLSPKSKETYVIPEFSLNIDYWFQAYVIKDLAAILKQIREFSSKDKAVEEFLTVNFTATIRAVSNTRKREFKRYRISPEDMKEHRPKVFDTFIGNVNKSLKLMRNFAAAVDEDYSVRLFKADSRKFKTEKKVDAIITSPPYGDSNTTVAYGQFSSLLMEWIGMNHGAWKKIDIEGLGGKELPSDVEIPAFPTFNDAYSNAMAKSPLRGEVLRSFVHDYQLLFRVDVHQFEIRWNAAIVIGDRTVFGVKIRNDLITVELAEQVGFGHVETLGRRILFKTMPYSTKPKARAGNAEMVQRLAMSM